MTPLRMAAAAAAIAAVAIGGWVWAGWGKVPDDPVERCRGILPSLLNNDALKNLRAEAVEPVGNDGCRFTGITAESRDPEMTLAIREADLSRLDFAAIYAGRPEATKTMHLAGMELGGPDVQRAFGTLKPFDIDVDYAFDPATQIMTLSQFSVRGDGFGDLRAAAVLQGTLDELWSDDDDLSNSKIVLHSLDLRFVDGGALQGFFDAVASAAYAWGPEKDAAAERIRTGSADKAAALADVGVPAPSVAHLVAFIHDFPSPRKPLSLFARPAKPVSLAQLARISPGDPDSKALIGSLNLTIDY